LPHIQNPRAGGISPLSAAATEKRREKEERRRAKGRRRPPSLPEIRQAGAPIDFLDSAALPALLQLILASTRHCAVLLRL
jgi:hypothetical protein